MAATGSLPQCRLLAQNPLTLPGRLQDRAPASIKAGRAWEGELRLTVTSAR
jgi:hypothetical protein